MEKLGFNQIGQFLRSYAGFDIAKQERMKDIVSQHDH
jgi:hypothetical protein